jgi:methionyl-tRNA formyltransferase
MRLILCGKNNAAIECLDFLLDRGDEVWVLGVAGDDGRDGWQRSLRAAAEGRGVRFEQPKRINDAAFVSRLAEFRADRLISIQYDQILRKVLFDGIGCPCLNLHFALLPRHRGVAPIAWAIVEGDDTAGVTLHHMVEDIDAGDVVAQRAVPIEAGDSARQVYDKVSEATVALFRECHPFPEGLLKTRLRQDSRRACYHRNGDFDFSARRIDWQRPALELHRWIRAMIFPPMQYPEIEVGGRRLSVARVDGAIGPPATVPPGTVVSRSGAGLDVAASDGVIRIRQLVDPARPQAGSASLIESVPIGQTLR